MRFSSFFIALAVVSAKQEGGVLEGWEEEEDGESTRETLPVRPLVGKHYLPEGTEFSRISESDKLIQKHKMSKQQEDLQKKYPHPIQTFSAMDGAKTSLNKLRHNLIYLTLKLQEGKQLATSEVQTGIVRLLEVLYARISRSDIIGRRNKSVKEDKTFADKMIVLSKLKSALEFAINLVKNKTAILNLTFGQWKSGLYGNLKTTFANAPRLLGQDPKEFSSAWMNDFEQVFAIAPRGDFLISQTIHTV